MSNAIPANDRGQSAAGSPAKDARIGVDIGGTFTDIVLQLADGTLFVSKVSTTPSDIAQAVVEGITGLLGSVGVAPAAVREIVHGTTVGSNTILQRSGARTGVLTTRGFRDVLEIGRIRTPNMFDLTWEKPEPLSPRRWRLEVDERLAADGSVVRPLNAEEVLAAGRRFVEESVEAVAICFINSYVNATHEREARELLEQAFPELAITASYEVLPEIKEYERTSTTVVNAYLLKEMRAYLDRLQSLLSTAGFSAPLLVMSSAGGIMGAELAARKPVFVVGSGPAGGVTGAARLSRTAGHPDAIVFDMGGTTAKAAIVDGGAPMLTSEYEFRDGISSPSRFIKGGGYMLKVPSIDIAEVGAGGGSIAWIDEGGLLRVGPHSTGADPGPACYNQGNDRPTVTDANVHLGLLNPQVLAGGTKKIFHKLASEAIRVHIAEPLGMRVDEAAHGIRQIANVNMARAIRSVTVERGRDPRDFTLLAFGGSGPVHAADLALQLGLRKVVVPILSGVFCSVGMLASNVQHNFVHALVARLDRLDAATFDGAMKQLYQESTAALASEGYAEGEATLQFTADLHYVGQSSELNVPVAQRPLDPGLMEDLHEAFQQAYHSNFGYSNDEPLELVNLRVSASGRRENRLEFDEVEANLGTAYAAGGKRPASFDRAAGFVATEVIARTDVSREARSGPLIIEAYDTTVAIPPGATVHADACGSLVIEIQDV
jgi:N-methylhydantoinase A